MYAKVEDNPEQSRFLRQLKSIFPSTPHWRLREVSNASNWHLGSCVDQLMNEVDNVPRDINDGISQQLLSNKENENVVSKGFFNKDEQRVGSLIKKGYRVLILMRGPPGVGKSYLAKSLLTNFLDLENSNYNINDFICSTDDYFYNAKGHYNYSASLIPDAHEYNHRRVNGKATSGLSPIIVDNTNMQLWEMLPYVKSAVQNNYLIEILEPKTSWSKSASTLARKNRHGVPRHRIEKIMEKYERASVDMLTRMLKNTKYTKTLPQMRSLPPFKVAPIAAQFQQTKANESPQKHFLDKKQSTVWDAITACESKQQRTKFKSNTTPTTPSKSQNNSPAASARNVYSLLEEKTTNVWKPFEAESDDFWKMNVTNQSKDSSKSVCSEKSLLDLLREDAGDAVKGLSSKQQDEANETKTVIFFERHSIDCPNEERAFVTLRQIYPNKRVSGLWDLFVKCNGDVDWAVDILLKEDELERIRGDDDAYQIEDDELYECACININGEIISKSPKSMAEINGNNSNKMAEEPSSVILNPAEPRPQRQRTRYSRLNQCTNPALLEVKENIENCFVLGDDQYSDHLLKIRNIRIGTNDGAETSNAATTESCENEIQNHQFMQNERDERNIEYEDDEEYIESEDSNEDMLEMPLGEQLIQQLVDTFRNESSLENQISSTLPANLKVFMPRSLAKQLYMLWMESAFNHIEEERQNVLREDEDFARLLKNPKYSEFKESPSNLHEILDMEYAWKIYNQDKDEQQQREMELEQQYMPTDLATHLTQMKICELFPDIPRETLLDMLETNGNDYNTTVAVLRSTMKMGDGCTTQEHLMQCAQQEQHLINQQAESQRRERVNKTWDDNGKSTLTPEEAKRLALREFEESRNLAAHHCQLKAECYQKAKEAIQSGNGGAAIYYSQIANLHIKKIDIYNHRAANCIMDVHKNTQNNPDLLDLHYLYLIEALGCLDLFLDRHITGLRQESRNYKHVFIITGRGKHSAGGVSTIKNKVKARLKERCLRWSEVNPGLLKVKIFSGSRHSKNI